MLSSTLLAAAKNLLKDAKEPEAIDWKTYLCAGKLELTS